MKVLYVSHTSEMHGSGKALFNIIEQMIKKGIQVHLVMPKARGSLYYNIKELKIEYSIQPVVSWVWPRLNTLRDFILFPYRLIRLITKSLYFYKTLLKTVIFFQPDIIHTNVGVTHLGHFIAKKLNIPHVWHIREYQDLYFAWKPFPSKNKFLKKLQDSNNYPIAITKGVYKHHNLKSNNNAKFIYDGVFDVTTIPSIKLAKKKYFLFVGLISEGKGTSEAINAFLAIAKQHPEYELWIAGGGAERYINKLKKDIAHSGGSKQIKFLGYRTGVYDLMSDATALIVPSKFEGFGFITAEAMFNGCLVIGKDTAGTKEQFDNGLYFTGEEIGIRYSTLKELIAVMHELCNNGIDTYHDKIKKAQKTVVKLYSSQKNADEIYHFYQKIIKS